MVGPGWTRIVLAGLVVLASACRRDAAEGSSVPPESSGPASVVVEAPAPAPKAAPTKAEPLSGRAVVRSGARLYYASTGDVSLVVPPLEGAPGVAVDVVGEQGDRLVIETLGMAPADHHCAAVMDGMRHVRLRFYVAKDELLPVLTEELEHDFGDGTSVRLARGVPVPPGAATLLVRRTPIRVPVPAERLGRTHVPQPPFPAGGGDGRLHPAGEGDELHYGGEPLAEDYLYGDGTGVLRYATMLREHDALVIVRNGCLEVTAAAPVERLQPPPPIPSLGAKLERHVDPLDDEDVWQGLIDEHRLAELGEGARIHEVRAGAAIAWVDGSPAGQVIKAHQLAQTRRDVGGRACFDVTLVASENAVMVLCFAAEDVRELELPPRRSLGHPGLRPADGGARPGFGGRGKAVPQVLQRKHTIEGSHDRDVVRRIVRAHINEVRVCYTAGLTRDPSLAGSVAIRFRIDGAGKVTRSSVAESTLAEPSVAQCIAKTVKRWTFTKSHDGGASVVTLPFELVPG